MDGKSVIAQRNKRLHSRSKALSPGNREATARVGTAMAIPLVLRRLGVDPSEVLADVGLSPGLFDDPDNPVTYAARCRLLNRCVERTGCSHFGLLVGQAEGLHSLGAVGYMAQSCDDVGTALRSICQLMHVQAQGTKVSLEVDGPLAIFQCEIYEPAAVTSDQTYDAAVAIMFNIMRALCGEDWRPARVLFAHRKPQQQCRLEIARQFLETSDMDVAAIAGTLRYANSSAFTRAFRR